MRFTDEASSGDLRFRWDSPRGKSATSSESVSNIFYLYSVRVKYEADVGKRVSNEAQRHPVTPFLQVSEDGLPHVHQKRHA